MASQLNDRGEISDERTGRWPRPQAKEELEGLGRGQRIRCARVSEETRRRFIGFFSGIGLSGTLLPGVLWAQLQHNGTGAITQPMLREALELSGLSFDEKDQQSMLEPANQNLARCSSRLIPAVEYLQGQRARTMMMMKLAEATAEVDVYLVPANSGGGGGGRGRDASKQSPPPNRAATACRLDGERFQTPRGRNPQRTATSTWPIPRAIPL